MAESFSRQKLRHALQKGGGREILCDLPPVLPCGWYVQNELDVQNEWEENTHTRARAVFVCMAYLLVNNEDHII